MTGNLLSFFLPHSRERASREWSRVKESETTSGRKGSRANGTDGTNARVASLFPLANRVKSFQPPLLARQVSKRRENSPNKTDKDRNQKDEAETRGKAKRGRRRWRKRTREAKKKRRKKHRTRPRRQFYHESQTRGKGERKVGVGGGGMKEFVPSILCTLYLYMYLLVVLRRLRLIDNWKKGKRGTNDVRATVSPPLTSSSLFSTLQSFTPSEFLPHPTTPRSANPSFSSLLTSSFRALHFFPPSIYLSIHVFSLFPLSLSIYYPPPSPSISSIPFYAPIQSDGVVHESKVEKTWGGRGRLGEEESRSEGVRKSGNRKRGGQTEVMEAGVDIVWHYWRTFRGGTLRYWFRSKLGCPFALRSELRMSLKIWRKNMLGGFHILKLIVL